MSSPTTRTCDTVGDDPPSQSSSTKDQYHESSSIGNHQGGASNQETNAAALIMRTMNLGHLTRTAGHASHPQMNQTSEHVKGRSRTVTNASLNLPKETKMLRQRLDRVIGGFQRSVTEHDAAQRHRMKILSSENTTLQSQVRILEVENLKLSNGLLDHEETINDLKVERQTLVEDLQFFRSELQLRKKQQSAAEARLETEKDDLVERNTLLERKMKEYNSILAERGEVINKLQAEVDRLRIHKSATKENDPLLSGHHRRSNRNNKPHGNNPLLGSSLSLSYESGEQVVKAIDFSNGAHTSERQYRTNHRNRRGHSAQHA